MMMMSTILMMLVHEIIKLPPGRSLQIAELCESRASEGLFCGILQYFNKLL
jgi:hypothetical protein